MSKYTLLLHFLIKCVAVIMMIPLAIGQASVNDTINSSHNAGFKKWIIPTAFITYGATSFYSSGLRNFDEKIKNLQPGHVVTHIDDYLIYLPIITDLSLNLGGVPSKHKLKDKAIIYLMSTGLNTLMVYPTKRWTTRIRPDHSDFHSFPSGHTSNAFVGAEFFWQEYKEKSTLLASSGYIIAAATGFLRIRNNKHWFSDVITGAGTGILSTKLIYHFYPMISKNLIGTSDNIAIIPYAAPNASGLSFVVRL